MTIETLTNLFIALNGREPCELSLWAWEVMTLEERLEDVASMEVELERRADVFAWEMVIAA